MCSRTTTDVQLGIAFRDEVTPRRTDRAEWNNWDELAPAVSTQSDMSVVLRPGRIADRTRSPS